MRLLDLEVQEGTVAALPADGVAISVDRAQSLGVGLGDDVTLWLGDGQRITPRVVGTYSSALGFGDLVLPRAAAAPHVSRPMDSYVLVKYADGAAADAMDARLAALAERVPGLEVLDRAGFDALAHEQAAEGAWVSYLLIGVLMAFVAIAAMNSLAMAIGERGRELALLRLVGATHRQVIRMIRGEALAVVGFGVFIGLVVAAATLVPFSLAIAETAIPYLPWPVIAGVVMGALLLGIVASELPARNALRRDPIEEIGVGE